VSSSEAAPPYVALMALGLGCLWAVLVWMQRSSLVRKYEEETTLGETQAVRKARLLLRFFGPVIRAGYYSMHLALISWVPANLVPKLPGYADVGPRDYVLEKFSTFERVMALGSTLAALAFLTFGLMAV